MLISTSFLKGGQFELMPNIEPQYIIKGVVFQFVTVYYMTVLRYSKSPIKEEKTYLNSPPFL